MTKVLLFSLAGVGWASAAWAQDPRPERLYLDSGALLGSTRMVGLGGAYAGVAEGADGLTSNLAAVGHRDRALDRRWDVDATFSLLNIPVGSPQTRDLDNSGSASAAEGQSQVIAGLLLQYSRFGLGTYFRSSSVWYCPTPGCSAVDLVSTSFTRASLAAAVAFDGDNVIVSAGFYGVTADFSFHQETWHYDGTGLELGVLFRPVGKPFRVGISGKPEVIAGYRPKPGQLPVIAGRPIYSATVSPGTLSIGASWRPESGGVRYNDRSPIAKKELVDKGAAAGPEAAKDLPPSRWLLSAQLDLIQPESSAVPLRTIANAAPEAVGQLLLWEPRAGAEYEILLSRLRVRLGSYLEPSAFPGRGPRPHLAGGFEVKLFHLVEDWDLSGSFDVSRQYFNLGVSIGWWRDSI